MTTTIATLRLAHSPDSDDAFMFHAVANRKIDTEGLEFVHILRDIETLNRMAMAKELEITALSVHAYAHLANSYALLSSGASMGVRYGPVVVARSPIPISELRHVKVAVPGEMTSAFLSLRLCAGDFRYQIMPFDEILEAVAAGQVDAGLLIHEGQLTFRRYGLVPIVELGRWWYDKTALPLPLGVNAIRKDLPDEVKQAVDRVLRRSIAYALDNREEALDYALRFARGLKPHLADRFVGMYVNNYTLDYGPDGKRAIRLFLQTGHDAGYLPRRVELEFITGD